MTNTKKHKSRKKNRRNNSLSMIIGAGLVLLGAALLILWPRDEQLTDAAATDGLSIAPAEVNFPAPQLALENVKGGKQSLEDFRGNVVLVNNWATWCPPCKAEMPTLNQYHEAHAAEGFTVIAVEAGDGREEVLEFANRLGLSFPVWLDPENASLAAIGNGSLPNSYVIDRAGAVRYAWTGEVNLAMLEKYITPLIAESN